MPLTRLDALGIGIFLAGLGIEAVADRQKDAAKRAAPEKPVMHGLFKYSVYPNYFGECLLWWGAYLLAFPVLASPAQHLAALACPVFDAFLLWRVSGIPLLEKSSWKKYGDNPDYVNYRSRTSVFFPWFPKSS